MLPISMDGEDRDVVTRQELLYHMLAPVYSYALIENRLRYMAGRGGIGIGGQIFIRDISLFGYRYREMTCLLRIQYPGITICFWIILRRYRKFPPP